MTIPCRLEPLGASTKMSDFERKYSPWNRHMICINWENKINKRKRSICKQYIILTGKKISFDFAKKIVVVVKKDRSQIVPK